MNNISRIVLVSLLTFLLAACASSSMVKNVNNEDLHNKALVIGSITESTTNAINKEPGTLVLSNPSGAVHHSLSPNFQGARSGIKDGIHKQKGTFFALLLVPGTYSIAEPYSEHMAAKAANKKARFSIRAGKIYYIGNFNLVVGNQTPGLGSEPKEAYFQVNNFSKRDVRLFKFVYPNLDWQQQLVIKLAKLSK